ncbi:DedA family protein [Dactylosporangium aurantiacum]|uniref:DedA family protein n=1 Tax=Dactylosporangium aurantiacum TaxID=35754 RepID=A0A9Q9I8K5_9ACTN|nr:DedA family protein [Dactylosporangium aurantiacum]UWZ50376.1 DedA family protein [Dactylosporangium aurantiacum]
MTATLAQVPPAAAYLIVVAAVLAESVLLIGAFVPSFTVLMAAGALARAGHLHLGLVILTAAGAVAAGDLLGQRTGRALGARLRTGRLGRRLPAAAWRRADTLMDRRGGQAVFIARFLPVLRTLVPHLAGATGLPYRRIAAHSLAAAPLWATIEAGIGYAATASLQHAVSLGAPALAVTAVAVIAAPVAWKKLRQRRRRAPLPVRARPASRCARPGKAVTRAGGRPRRSRSPRRSPRPAGPWSRSAR